MKRPLIVTCLLLITLFVLEQRACSIDGNSNDVIVSQYPRRMHPAELTEDVINQYCAVQKTSQVSLQNSLKNAAILIAEMMSHIYSLFLKNPEVHPKHPSKNVLENIRPVNVIYDSQENKAGVHVTSEGNTITLDPSTLSQGLYITYLAALNCLETLRPRGSHDSTEAFALRRSLAQYLTMTYIISLDEFKNEAAVKFKGWVPEKEEELLAFLRGQSHPFVSSGVFYNILKKSKPDAGWVNLGEQNPHKDWKRLMTIAESLQNKFLEIFVTIPELTWRHFIHASIFDFKPIRSYFAGLDVDFAPAEWVQTLISSESKDDLFKALQARYQGQSILFGKNLVLTWTRIAELSLVDGSADDAIGYSLMAQALIDEYHLPVLRGAGRGKALYILGEAQRIVGKKAAMESPRITRECRLNKDTESPPSHAAFAQVEKYLEEAKTLLDPHSLYYAKTLLSLATIYYDIQRLTESIKLREEALLICDEKGHHCLQGIDRANLFLTLIKHYFATKDYGKVIDTALRATTVVFLQTRSKGNSTIHQFSLPPKVLFLVEQSYFYHSNYLGAIKSALEKLTRQSDDSKFTTYLCLGGYYHLLGEFGTASDFYQLILTHTDSLPTASQALERAQRKEGITVDDVLYFQSLVE